MNRMDSLTRNSGLPPRQHGREPLPGGGYGRASFAGTQAVHGGRRHRDVR